MIANRTMKNRGDGGFQANVAERRVEIHNFPATGTEATLNAFISAIDSEMDPHEIAQNARITTPLELDSGGRSKSVRVTLEMITPSERFCRWANGEADTGNETIDNLVLHRDFTRVFASRPEYGTLLADTRDKQQRTLFALLKVCNFSRFEAEQLLRREMAKSLDKTPYGGQIVAVHIDDVSKQDGNGPGRLQLLSISDPKCRMRIHMRDLGAAQQLVDKVVRPSITMGGGKTAVTIEIPLRLHISKETIEAKAQALTAEQDDRARREAEKYEPARLITRVSAYLKIRMKKEEEKNVRKRSVGQIEQMLMDGLGGPSSGIYGMQLSRDDRLQPDFDGRYSSHIWFLDLGETTQAETKSVQTFLTRLKEGRCLDDTTLFSSITSKGDATSVHVPPAMTSGLCKTQPLTLEQVKNIIKRHLYGVGSMYFSAQDRHNNAVVLPGDGRTCTSEEDLGPIGDVDDDGGVRRVDMRSLFKAGEATVEMQLKSMMQLKADGAIVVYDPDEHVFPTGKTGFTMYSAYKDVYAEERVKEAGAQGGDDDDSEGDDDVSRDKDKGLDDKQRDQPKDQAGDVHMT
jgi:hypothetical protein